MRKTTQKKAPVADPYTSRQTPEPRRTETDAALEAGELLAAARFQGQALRIDGGRPYRITEADAVESLEGFLRAPVSRRGEIAVYDAPSFVGYVNRFQDDGSVIFADKAAATFTGVLDYHEAGEGGPARWGRHRAVLALRQTRAWQTWAALNGKPLNQEQFARHIEENIPDIAEPDGALLVEMARTLAATKSVVFESNVLRQTDGSFKFHYAEEVQGSTHRRDLKIPDLFVLSLQPFEGSEKAMVVARFRFRVGDGGKLAMWYELVRIEDVLEKAFVAAEQAIIEGVEGTFIVNGPAPASVTA